MRNYLPDHVQVSGVRAADERSTVSRVRVGSRASGADANVVVRRIPVHTAPETERRGEAGRGSAKKRRETKRKDSEREIVSGP